MNPPSFGIRPCADADLPAVEHLLTAVFRSGDTYAIDANLPSREYLSYWTGAGHSVFVAHDAESILGTYYLCRNQGGGGAHVCNCGYMTAPAARGRGVARAMLAHSLDMARQAGYRAMQYNFVVSTNVRAIALWRCAGFREVGRLSLAFHHPTEGYVDALVMMKSLTGQD